jgi:FkbM family methyltransferase
VSFISFAQNMEDVMLFRALKQVEHGFYIDVGARDPVDESVTKAFYDRGWSGINVEPLVKYFRLLEQDRNRDINLNVLVGCRQGEQTFYEVGGTGLSTVKEDYAEYHSAAGYKIEKRVVACTTLDSICIKYNVNAVHFLKIDVEGSEQEVLQGINLDTIRPWIVLAEVHAPFGEDMSMQWEHLLTEKEYQQIYYDGVNRFYLAAEHSDLSEHFRFPPNIFDDYVLYRGIVKTEAALRCEADAARKDLQRVYSSRSWRVTAPLRKLCAMVIHRRQKTSRSTRE